MSFSQAIAVLAFFVALVLVAAILGYAMHRSFSNDNDA